MAAVIQPPCIEIFIVIPDRSIPFLSRFLIEDLAKEISEMAQQEQRGPNHVGAKCSFQRRR